MILITRPKDEAKELAEILERQNFACLIEPMIKISHLKPDWQTMLDNPVQAFITTSKNARKFIPPGHKLAAIPEHGKNARQLCEWIVKNLKPQDGHLVYLRGDIISFDMACELRKHFFEVDEEIIYESIAPEAFSPSLLNNFSKIELALFFSKHSLENFIGLAMQSKLQTKLKNLRILCLSEDIAKAAESYKLAAVFVADEPNLSAMINKIDEIY